MMENTVREAKTSEMTDTFLSECASFAQETNSFGYDVSDGEFCFEKKVTVSYAGFDLMIHFTRETGKIHNLLEMRIKFRTEKRTPSFSLYDLLFLIDTNDFKTYIFPYITSEELLKKCLAYLFDTFKKYKGAIEGIAADEALLRRAIDTKRKEMKEYLREDIYDDARRKNDDPELDRTLLELKEESYREWYLRRFMLPWYKDYLKKEFKRAASKFAAYEAKTNYEIRLARFIKALETGAEYEPVPEEINTYVSGSDEITKKIIVPRIIYFALLCLACATGAALIYIAFHLFADRGAYFVSSFFSVRDIIILCGIAYLCALGLFGINKDKLVKSEDRKAMEEAGILVPEKEKKTKPFLGNVFIASAALAILLLSASAYRVYDGYIVDRNAIVTSKTLSFDDIIQKEENSSEREVFVVFENNPSVYRIPSDAFERAGGK